MWGHSALLASESGTTRSSHKTTDMNTNNNFPSAKKWIKAAAIFVIALSGFSYLYRHGVSPVWAAALIVLFPGIFRFIYRAACFLVALAILIAIIRFIII
jgi:Ni,Fe-hydrogenase I cytochrome b subunit